uniref:DinB family protein n=1 Tax=unclassified Rhodococcus (in: high G+C Gram-positive bacteria) TaxID=192944 RepID=UPI0020CE0D41|nr:MULTISPECIES: DinB family protein [unclassified Rhodococcus (in: high G+C Gram-positive bacteria)]
MVTSQQDDAESRVADAVLAITGGSLSSMTEILRDLGDELANTKPDLPGANSPYAIVFHCVAVIEYWAGSVIAGLKIPRDRATEFTATGRVDDVITRVDDVRARLPEWVEVALREGIRDRTVIGTTRPELATATPEWVLTHLVRELAQHLGQLELTRDILRQA